MWSLLLLKFMSQNTIVVIWWAKENEIAVPAANWAKIIEKLTEVLWNVNDQITSSPEQKPAGFCATTLVLQVLIVLTEISFVFR